MAAVPQESRPIQSEVLGEVVDFSLLTQPFNLDITYVNYPEPIDPSVRMRSEIRTSAANHTAGVIGFGGWVVIVEIASIPDVKTAVAVSTLSFIGNTAAWYKSFKSERRSIEAKYTLDTE